MAIETISYFMRNGSEIFSCMMDMSKAFETLFRKVLGQGMPCIVYRGETKPLISSPYAMVSNKVPFLSAVLYCAYTNGMFEKLKRQNRMLHWNKLCRHNWIC